MAVIPFALGTDFKRNFFVNSLFQESPNTPDWESKPSGLRVLCIETIGIMCKYYEFYVV